MSDRAGRTVNLVEATPAMKRTRLAVALIYFCMGLCFASWASRIPDIKTTLHLSAGQLGSILFALPVGQLLMMPFSGRLVTRFGSHRTILFALPAYSLCLNNIGWVNEGWQLAIALFLFGISGNLSNISINTQGVTTEKLYGRPIMATFHGGWSLAGFTGALVGLVMINLGVEPRWHFLTIIVLVWIVLWINHPYLNRTLPATTEENARRRFFSRPDPILLQLGIICFCSMASEGAMFDWSGVYFKDVIKVKPSLVVLGYTSFMIMMASGRFMADRIISRIGRQKMLQISGIMISAGLFTSVIFPYLVPCTIAFMVVGLGVSSIVPTVYSTAGSQAKVPAGIALATVSSVGFLGFLMGPPLIGHVAELFGLRYSFTIIGLFGIGVSYLVTRVTVFRLVEKQPHVEDEEEAISSFGELP
ncbi:MAG: MFS transporter [Bacteroidales bacterium]